MTTTARRLIGRLPGIRRLRASGDRFVRVRVAEDTADVRARLDALDALGELARWADVERLVTERTAPFAEVRAALDGLRFDLDRLVPVVSALEVRLEGMHRSADRFDVPDPEGARVARDLVEEIRREHGRVRARLGAVAAFEERLRRLETGSGVH